MQPVTQHLIGRPLQGGGTELTNVHISLFRNVCVYLIFTRLCLCLLLHKSNAKYTCLFLKSAGRVLFQFTVASVVMFIYFLKYCKGRLMLFFSLRNVLPIPDLVSLNHNPRQGL